MREEWFMLAPIRKHIEFSLMNGSSSTSTELVLAAAARCCVTVLVVGTVSVADADDARPRKPLSSAEKFQQEASDVGVIGGPSRATVLNKQVIINSPKRTLDAVMVVAHPFSIAYGISQLSNVLVIDIGAGTIDICPMYGPPPKDEDQITLPIGGNLIDDEFQRLVMQSQPRAEFTLNQSREIKEEFGFVCDGKENAIATVPIAGEPTQLDVTRQLNAACRTIVPGIAEALLELHAKFDRNVQKSLFNNILAGGGGGQLKGLDLQIVKAPKPYGVAKVTQVYDAVFAGATGSLKLATNMPAEYWRQIVAPTGSVKPSKIATACDPLNLAA
jgi:rod shape-determining protein MreB